MSFGHTLQQYVDIAVYTRCIHGDTILATQKEWKMDMVSRVVPHEDSSMKEVIKELIDYNMILPLEEEE